MADPIIYIDHSKIRPGRLNDVKEAILRLVDFIDAREPQLLFYGFSVDEEAQRMTVLAVHPDAASVEYHMDVGGAAFRSFAELIEMQAIEVYGDPSQRMLEQLEQKAKDLGEQGTVRVGRLQAGFSRLAAPADDHAADLRR